mmetsp:Transcript_164072/g.526159  ORF Transcript_164072/g.526159 Transcript_164072/m.526159 type:complete len:270 (+) Transcript_164072:764-1573(+)
MKSPQESHQNRNAFGSKIVFRHINIEVMKLRFWLLGMKSCTNSTGQIPREQAPQLLRSQVSMFEVQSQLAGPVGFAQHAVESIPCERTVCQVVGVLVALQPVAVLYISLALIHGLSRLISIVPVPVLDIVVINTRRQTICGRLRMLEPNRNFSGGWLSVPVFFQPSCKNRRCNLPDHVRWQAKCFTITNFRLNCHSPRVLGDGRVYHIAFADPKVRKGTRNTILTGPLDLHSNPLYIPIPVFVVFCFLLRALHPHSHGVQAANSSMVHT